MRQAVITPSLYLTAIPVKADAPTKTVNQGKNNIWIIDRSGSMSWELKNVIEDCIDRVNSLPAGDTLTVGWFSSEGGQFGWIVKGLRIINADERQAATTILRRYTTTVGATCFSEILTDLNTVVGDLVALSPNFALMFMSDGFPVVSDYRAEINKIDGAIEDVAGTLNTVLLVGYGDYYNRELMGKMAEKFGGGLIHSSNLKVFSTAFEKFVNESANVQQRIQIGLPRNCGEKLAVFSVTGSQVTLYQPDDFEDVAFAPTGQDDELYVLTTQPAKGAKGASLGELERGAYAAAYVLSQKMKADIALEILGKLGDVDLIKQLNSAYTNDEAGKAEAAILRATTNPTWRYYGGKDTKFLPDPNAFCVLDALDLLAADEQARFYPLNPSFQYKRIGRPAVTKEGYPKFVPQEGASSPLNTLTYHDEKLNVSIKTSLPGTVRLNAHAPEFGFPQEFPTVRFRDYSVIADGVLNVSVLPVSLGPDSFNRLQAAGAINPSLDYKGPDENYLVNLDELPVINRGMANGLTSARKLCGDISLELELEGKLKAFKFLRAEKDPDKTILRTTEYTPEQEAFLAENGIDQNGRYAPPTERGEATDWNIVKHFRVTAKGYSSLPSIKDVRERMDKGKPPTPTGQLVLMGLAMFEQMAPHDNVQDELAWLDGAIYSTRAALREIRKPIQRTKFAILLSRKWFDEFSSREENTLEVDGVTFKIEVTEKREEI